LVAAADLRTEREFSPASSTRTAPSGDTIDARAEDLIFAGTNWEPIGTWHSHVEFREVVRPEPR
jgi:hypothetical protein